MSDRLGDDMHLALMLMHGVKRTVAGMLFIGMKIKSQQREFHSVGLLNGVINISGLVWLQVNVGTRKQAVSLNNNKRGNNTRLVMCNFYD